MKKYFLTGVILLLPIALTLAIIAFVVNFLTKPFMGVVAHILSSYQIANKGFLIFSPEQTLRYTSQLIILVCLFLVILTLGMLARYVFIKWIFLIGEKILHKLPLVNKVYKTTKDIVTHLFSHGKNTFRKVVLVPFPGHDIYAIGLLSEDAPKECSEKIGEELLSVFVATAPNPATGFVIMYKKSDLIFLDMKPEDAIKYIVSCGVVTPELNGNQP
ncbi:MAG: DUF502 domain-containing protein [Chlamydiae bacterium]|jgi:uncharacterized membrane protein|nr:DUF502 domain-containing protein [Chlamydiota bacterium]